MNRSILNMRSDRLKLLPDVMNHKKYRFECKICLKQLNRQADQNCADKRSAGIGKSVSVQKFVLDWAEGKENQDISFIFPLPFREMNLKETENQSLMGLITQFFPETKGLNLTRRNNSKSYSFLMDWMNVVFL